MQRLSVYLWPEEYAVARFPVGQPVPGWLFEKDGFVSVTRTAAEVSVICPAVLLPPGESTSKGWRLLTVDGPLDFTLTGVMASLAGSLAAAGVPLFAMSTYETDHILVKHADLDRAVTALREAGHEVR
jgi:hypothetical protein